MLISTLLASIPVLASPAAQAPAPEVYRVALAPCRAESRVQATWSDERRSDVRATSNGSTLPTYATHEARRIDRTIEVAECRAGVPAKLHVRYGEVNERRLDGDPEPDGVERAAGEPVYRTERLPIAGRTYTIVQVGEAADVVYDGSSVAPSIAALVLEAESIEGGAVPLPGDDVARALGAEPRTAGVPFAFDAHVARMLLGGGEQGACAATFTFHGVERPEEGPARARFGVHIAVHEEPVGGLVRDAELVGTLYADPRDGRPLDFAVQGQERQIGAAGDGSNAAEFEVRGTWSVRRTWTWH